jgi:hypothetical protein
MVPKKKTPFAIVKNRHGAFLVLCGEVALCVHTERASSEAVRDALMKDFEVPFYAACLPCGTKIWKGAVGAIINDAYGRESSDYANVCQLLWNKVKAARQALNLI